MKKKDLVIAGSILLVGIVVITYLGKDAISQRFPNLGVLIQSGFGIGFKPQEAAMVARQTETLQNANSAIAAAEQIARETPEPVANLQTAQAVVNRYSPPWQLSPAGSDIRPISTLDPKIKVFSAVVVEPHPTHKPVAGEQIELPMFNGKSVKVNVEHTTNTANGDYIWSGHVAGQNSDYPVVMTYGKTTTFATITTPEGSYSLEAVEGTGWLYKNPAEAELMSQLKDDFIFPDEHL